MNTLSALNEVMEYIENHLEYEIDDAEIAKRACCSAYHFKRTFSFLAGISLQEYARRRRLSRAAMELQDPAVKVIDVAIKYGYNSPDSFTRAFQALHGMTPTEARDYKRSVKSYPPMTFQLYLGGSDPMEIKVERMDSFQVVGIKNEVTAVDEGEHPGVNEVWRTTTQEMYDELKSLNNTKPYGIIHIDVNRKINRTFDYYFAVATTKPCPEQFTSLTIPEMTWAKIQVKVPWTKEKWKYIYGEWFPASGYEEIAGYKIQIGPEVQVGLDQQIFTQEVDAELWIPVRKVK